MNSRMLLVTQSGKVDDLYSLIKAAPDILQNADVLPFVHTPLHEASSTGKIDLAMELMLLKPSFAKKLNEDGFSPLHLAVENKQDTLAIELVKFDPSLVRIRGRGGMTPLHLVAKKGGVDLLIKFLQACPGSINDANLNGETAVHITVMNNKYEELKVLIGWMQKMRSSDGAFCEIHVMNQCDREGNTALHLAAAYENNHKAVKQLLKCMSLNRNIQNKSKLTALDVLQTNGAHMNMDTVKILQKSGGKTGGSIRVQTMHEFLRNPVTFREYCSTKMARYRSRMSDGARNSLLVITGLIIAATYQTAAQPKDKDDNNDWEKLVIQFVLQWGFNTIAFGAAMVLTFILLPFGGAYTWWYIVITVPLVCSYGLCLYIKFRSYQQWLVISTYVTILFGSLVYLLIFYVRWKRNMHKKVPKPKRELTSQKTTV